MSYAIYLRKSRADIDIEKQGEGETLARHERILLNLAKASEYPISKIYREIVSGDSIASRPQMQMLLQDVSDGLYDGVLVMELERLTRGNAIDQGIVAQTFRMSNTLIITPNKTYDLSKETDETFAEFSLFMSRLEYKTIKRRMYAGREASVREGNFIGSIPPYGYDKVKTPDGHYSLKPNEEEAPIVKMIFQMYTDGYPSEDGTIERIGTARISNHLNSANIRTRRNSDWQPCTIRDILRNPTYIGKLRWNFYANGRPRFSDSPYGTESIFLRGGTTIGNKRQPMGEYLVVNGVHPPLISREQFEKAQQIIDRNVRRPIPAGKACQNPLAGFVKCSVCGRTMVRTRSTTRPDVHLACPMRKCPTVSSLMPLVEKRLIDSLKGIMEQYKVQWKESESALQSAAEPLQQSIQQMHHELKKLNQQREKVFEYFEQGIYPPETYLERSKSVNNKIEELNTQLQQATVTLEHLQTEHNRRAATIPQLEHLLDVYSTLDNAADQNALLKTVIDKVIYSKHLKGSKNNKHSDSFKLDIYLKLPEAKK